MLFQVSYCFTSLYNSFAIKRINNLQSKQLFTAQDLKSPGDIKVALHPKEVLDKVSLDMQSKHLTSLSLKSSEAITSTRFQNFGGHYNAVLLDWNEPPISCTHHPL